MPVSVTVLAPQFRTIERAVSRLGGRVLRTIRVPRAACDVYLADGRAMRRLGARLRSHRGPWNVLAFPAPRSAPRPDVRMSFLGEIYLNPAVIAREARHGALPAYAVRADERVGIPGAAFAYYLVHGILHLRGYDHVRHRDRIAMEREEERIFRRVLEK